MYPSWWRHGYFWIVQWHMGGQFIGSLHIGVCFERRYVLHSWFFVQFFVGLWGCCYLSLGGSLEVHWWKVILFSCCCTILSLRWSVVWLFFMVFCNYLALLFRVVIAFIHAWDVEQVLDRTWWLLLRECKVGECRGGFAMYGKVVWMLFGWLFVCHGRS